MPRENREITIDGTTYRVKQLGAHTGSQVLFRVGRALPTLMSGVGIRPEDLSPEDFNYVVECFKKHTQVSVTDTNGGGGSRFIEMTHGEMYDDLFAGHYERMFAWMKFSWEVNFSSFFGAVAGLVRARKDLATSVSPKAATGSAGDSSSANA